MFNKFRQIRPIVISGTIGFLIATVLFLPKIYPSNQNLYRIIRERINVHERVHEAQATESHVSNLNFMVFNIGEIIATDTLHW